MPGSGAVAAACTADEGSPDEGSPGEVKPGDLSVRENEGILPSAQRALKNQGWRSVTSCEPQGVQTAEKAWLRALRTK